MEKLMKLAKRQQLLKLLRSNKGMTLVEVMVVIAIVATLMGFLGITVMGSWEDSKADMTKLQIGQVNQKVQLYSLRKGVPGSGEGLSAVYGSESVPKDNWGQDIQYASPGPDGSEYDIFSYGADGTQGGEGNKADIHLSDLKRQ
jgi:general secretion pathway protein G